MKRSFVDPIRIWMPEIQVLLRSSNDRMRQFWIQLTKPPLQQAVTLGRLLSTKEVFGNGCPVSILFAVPLMVSKKTGHLLQGALWTSHRSICAIFC
jgi:hypothetical protein